MISAKTSAKLPAPHFIGDKFRIFIIEENIFRMMPFEGVYLELEDAYEMRRVFKELSKGAKYAVLIDGTNFFSSSPEMRKLTSNKEYSAYRFATALVTNLLANRIFGNFFLSFNQPSSPTRIFNKEENALAWIKKQQESL